MITDYKNRIKEIVNLILLPVGALVAVLLISIQTVYRTSAEFLYDYVFDSSSHSIAIPSDARCAGFPFGGDKTGKYLFIIDFRDDVWSKSPMADLCVVDVESGRYLRFKQISGNSAGDNEASTYSVNLEYASSAQEQAEASRLPPGTYISFGAVPGNLAVIRKDVEGGNAQVGGVSLAALGVNSGDFSGWGLGQLQQISAGDLAKGSLQAAKINENGEKYSINWSYRAVDGTFVSDEFDGYLDEWGAFSGSVAATPTSLYLVKSSEWPLKWIHRLRKSDGSANAFRCCAGERIDTVELGDRVYLVSSVKQKLRLWEVSGGRPFHLIFVRLLSLMLVAIFFAYLAIAGLRRVRRGKAGA